MMSKGFLRPLEGADRTKAWEGERTGEAALEVYRQITASPDLAVRLDDNGAGTLYVGTAEPGASESAPVWKIKQLLTFGGQVSILWADGESGFTKVWANRAGYTYL